MAAPTLTLSCWRTGLGTWLILTTQVTILFTTQLIRPRNFQTPSIFSSGYNTTAKKSSRLPQARYIADKLPAIRWYQKVVL